MTRMRGALWAGALTALLWLASALASAVLPSVAGGPTSALLAPATWRLEPTGATALEMIGAPLIAMLLVAAVTAFAAAIVLDRASGGSPVIVGAALWFFVALAAVSTAAVAVVGRLLGAGTPPGSDAIALEIATAVGPALHFGALYGWIPALVGVLATGGTPHPASRAYRRVRGGAEGIAVVSAIALIAVIATQMIAIRTPGALAGSTSTPIAEVVVTPPPLIATGAPAPATGWCTSSALQIDLVGVRRSGAHRAATLTARNTGTVPCLLPDYPDIALADGAGGQLPVTVTRGAVFMAVDGGAASPLLGAGVVASSVVGWDAGTGSAAGLYAAPWAGARRTAIALSPTWDVAGGAVVGVTAWRLGVG